MRDKVIEWLKNGANAQDGAHLMEQAGARPLTLRLINANPPANKRMIVRFLCEKYAVEDNYKLNWQTPEIIIQEKVKPFREEFPFLNAESCPVELEALASRKFSRYHAYVSLHRKLRDCTSLEECSKISKELIDNYIENRLIWDELNYYQKHGELLGKHPIFIEFSRRKELLSLSVKELIFRQQKIENNIWRVNNELKKGNKPHLELERKERLLSYESELKEVKRLLE